MKTKNMAAIGQGQTHTKIQESDISSFEFKSVDGALLATVGVVAINDQPWFMASDVAVALGYSQTQSLTKIVDDEDKNSAIIQNGCNYQNQSVINESGLYTAVIGSNKPEAKRFKRWITVEVLPEIRKTGGYLLPTMQTKLPDFTDEVAAARAWADAREEGRKALALSYQQAEYIHHLESLFADGLTPVQFCKRLNGVNTSRINAWLSGKSWLFDENPNGRHARWRVYAYARDRYLTEKNTRVAHGEGFTAFTPVLLHKGAVWIYRHYLKGELPMKANWNGEYTHDKELAGGDMQGLNKTKAALQGRQCNYRKIKPSQITTLIDQVNNLGRVANMQLGIGMQRGQAKRCDKKCNGHKLTAPLAQLTRDARKSAHTGNSTYLKSLATWWVHPNLDRPDMSDCPQWGKSTPMADTLRNSGLSAHSPGASLAFLRWRRLISPFTAVTMNCAFVSPLSRLPSISATISCGNLAFSCCDFLLIEPVAITESPCDRCDSVYAKKTIKKDLKCDSPDSSVCCVGAIHLSSAKPGSVSPLTGPLTTNVNASNEVAMLNHTQTRPKYQYRFLALHRSDRSAAPCRLSVEAFTEKEARQVLSAHFILSLAARLPVSEVRHA